AALPVQPSLPCALRPPSSARFPYTTLFRSSFNFYYRFGGDLYNQTLVDRVENADPRFNVDRRVLEERWKNPGDQALYKNIADLRSEEHTSELQSRENLVCRLLLEKKKQRQT